MKLKKLKRPLKNKALQSKLNKAMKQTVENFLSAVRL